jgi:hypothetical protein
MFTEEKRRYLFERPHGYVQGWKTWIVRKRVWKQARGHVRTLAKVLHLSSYAQVCILPTTTLIIWNASILISRD